MENKAAMLEAVKRKRFLLQHESDSKGEHDEGQSTHSEDNELAPSGESSQASSHDALLGKPDGKDSPMDAESPKEGENETALGKQGGFNKTSKKSPENSKNLFVNTKKDSHDPVDLNKNRNMAGADRQNNQHDDMGVDVHENPRLQSSKMAFHNSKKAEAIKNSSRKEVKSDMDIEDNVPSHGEDNPDASPDNTANDKPRLSGLKGARAKLDGFLSKMKK